MRARIAAMVTIAMRAGMAVTAGIAMRARIAAMVTIAMRARIAVTAGIAMRARIAAPKVIATRVRIGAVTAVIASGVGKFQTAGAPETAEHSAALAEAA